MAVDECSYTPSDPASAKADIFVFDHRAIKIFSFSTLPKQKAGRRANGVLVRTKTAAQQRSRLSEK
jgi:hypothetical protein